MSTGKSDDDALDDFFKHYSDEFSFQFLAVVAKVRFQKSQQKFLSSSF